MAPIGRPWSFKALYDSNISALQSVWLHAMSRRTCRLPHHKKKGVDCSTPSTNKSEIMGYSLPFGRIMVSGS